MNILIRKLFFSPILLLLVVIQLQAGQNTIDLSGTWKVRLDTSHALFRQNPDMCRMDGDIRLPASLAEQGFGYKTDGSDFGVLTPEYKYIGKAWYSRDIDIPGNWEGKNIEIFLERVLWESRVFINGKEMTRQDALGTPHIHALGKLSAGKHTLTVMVDNEMIYNIGDKGHAYGDYTQSIWNGIVGRMEMKAYDPVRIFSTKIYSDVSKDQLRCDFNIISETKISTKMNWEIISISNGNKILSDDTTFNLHKGNNSFYLQIPLQGKLEKWSEFNPEVYLLRSTISTADYLDFNETEFGFQEVSHDGTKILINGNPVFLRGNLDCVHFPITGYPSCDLEDWEKIFRIYKEYGLNHARFHSWCPPEAAFLAANRIGIYLQAEASIWIDWWMSEDMNLKGRPEMDTKGHPKGLGYDIERDQFVIEEMNRMVDHYGNHPSFTMFCIGNELGNSDFDVMKGWVADLKEKDLRRLYAISTARKITDIDDYSATHYIREAGRTRGLNGPHTDWDFEEVYSKMNIPIIAHEIGQWPVYPRWSEIEKYNGVLKARNLMELRELAEKNGIDGQADDFADASGALNQIMYKYEIESFLRTASCAGVQLLSMQDYQGQGEALIGWLDAHWESKNITTPEKFRQHYNTTVPLLRLEKFVWQTNETFSGAAQLSHHGPEPFRGTLLWKIIDDTKKEIAAGRFDECTVAPGTLFNLGKINLDLKNIKKAGRLNVKIAADGTLFQNEWNFWVYPESVDLNEDGDVLITGQLNDKVKERMEKGGKVLLIANELGSPTHYVKAQFYPLYWSLTFFPGQGKTSIGLLVQDKHMAFRDFPTSYHSDWQWETISQDARGFILNDLPGSYKPIAQPVDDFHRNNKIGSIFELKVGKGSLLVSGYDLGADIPVAVQLKKSLLDYMRSSDFDPALSVSFDWLEKVLTPLPSREDTDMPDEFKDAILYVDAGGKGKQSGMGIPWEKELDNILIEESASYQLTADGVWNDGAGSAWYGKKMKVHINCPKGMLGTLYVHFQDLYNLGRTGILQFEGREVNLGKVEEGGQWVKFHVMREDSNDGNLILNTQTLSGPNLMITKLVLVAE
jgi:hypothetical protein